MSWQLVLRQELYCLHSTSMRKHFLGGGLERVRWQPYLASCLLTAFRACLMPSRRLMLSSLYIPVCLLAPSWPCLLPVYTASTPTRLLSLSPYMPSYCIPVLCGRCVCETQSTLLNDADLRRKEGPCSTISSEEDQYGLPYFTAGRHICAAYMAVARITHARVRAHSNARREHTLRGRRTCTAAAAKKLSALKRAAAEKAARIFSPAQNCAENCCLPRAGARPGARLPLAYRDRWAVWKIVGIPVGGRPERAAWLLCRRRAFILSLLLYYLFYLPRSISIHPLSLSSL